MVTKNQAKNIRLKNVNSGLLKRDENGYFIEIPVYPMLRNKQNVLYLFNKNAPVDFMRCLTNNVSNKDVVFYTYRVLENVNINKDDFIREFEDLGYNDLFLDVYEYLKNNTIEDSIKYMTSLNNDNIPFLTYNKIFKNDF